MSASLASVFVMSAPSGAGKSSLVREILQKHQSLKLSVSHTTRPPRSGEIEGVDYHFVSKPDFLRMQDQGEFLEFAEVYGNFYGTSQRGIRESLEKGIDVLLEIDWQGARQVRKLFPDCVDIFVLPPRLESLRERLESRGTDPPETIARRLAAAHEDLSHVNEFQYVIINDNFSEAVEDLSAILRARRCRREAQRISRPDLFSF